MSTLIHEAARIRLGIQRCRRCGYTLHDHRDWPGAKQNDVKWAAGALVVTRLDPPYRSSWNSKNCPREVLAIASFCDAQNTDSGRDK